MAIVDQIFMRDLGFLIFFSDPDEVKGTRVFSELYSIRNFQCSSGISKRIPHRRHPHSRITNVYSPESDLIATLVIAAWNVIRRNAIYRKFVSFPK